MAAADNSAGAASGEEQGMDKEYNRAEPHTSHFGGLFEHNQQLRFDRVPA